MLFSKANSAKLPINGTFELTSNCNFNCRMCYVHSCKYKSENIGFKQWKNLIDEACENGLLYVLLTGGEPLLHSEFKDIYSYLYKKGVISVINTNGYLIDSEYIKFFKEMPPSRINMTLYGVSDGVYKNLCGVPDGFTKVRGTVDSLKDNGFNLNFNMTFVKSNIAQMKEMLEFAKSRNITVRPTTYVFPSAQNTVDERLDAETAAEAAVEIYALTRSESEIKKYAKDTYLKVQAARNSQAFEKEQGTACRAGKSSYWVHSNGKLNFCGMTDNTDCLNAFEAGFKTAWDYAVKKARCVVGFSKCTVCEYRLVCRKCYAMFESENITEQNMGDSYTCKYYEAYAKALINIYERDGKYEAL